MTLRRKLSRRTWADGALQQLSVWTPLSRRSKDSGLPEELDEPNFTLRLAKIPVQELGVLRTLAHVNLPRHH